MTNSFKLAKIAGVLISVSTLGTSFALDIPVDGAINLPGETNGITAKLSAGSLVFTKGDNETIVNAYGVVVNGEVITSGTNGTNGKDGKDGTNGTNGLDGAKGDKGDTGVFDTLSVIPNANPTIKRIDGDIQQLAISQAVDQRWNVLEMARIEAGLDTKISEETSRAKGAEAQLQANIESEAKARRTADEVLTLAIAKEEMARTIADGKLDGMIRTETARATAAEAKLDAKIDAETARATANEKVIAHRVTQHARVAGAIVVNTIGNELLPESVKEDGYSVYGTVSGVGVSKDVGNGVSVSVATDGVGVSKSHDLTENIRLQATVGTNSSIGAFVHKDGNGIGVSNFGASVMVQNHVIPLTPHGFVVSAVSGAINSVTGKTQAKIAKLEAENASLLKRLDALEARLK